MRQNGDIKQYNGGSTNKRGHRTQFSLHGRLSARDMCDPHSVPKMGRSVY